MTSQPAPADKIPLEDHERTRCEVWTRVMGYHRPISQWNIGKQAEHRTRKSFLEPKPVVGDVAE